MLRLAPVYIVTSPNQKVGKTLIARLLIEFFQASGRAVEGYDLQSRKPALAERFPHLVRSVDIGDTRGQMQVFDRLLTNNTTTKIVDLRSGPFDQHPLLLPEFQRHHGRSGQSLPPADTQPSAGAAGTWNK